MSIRIPGLTLLAAALLGLLPGRVSAQTTSLFADAIHHLTPGTDVKVVDTSGRSITGRLEQVEGDAIVVTQHNQTLRFTTANVRTVATRPQDTVLDGLAAGGLIGTGLGAAAGAALSRWDNEDYIEARDVWIGALGGGLAGVAIGAVWDAALRKTTVVYNSTTTVALAPFVTTHGGRGMRVQFRW